MDGDEETDSMSSELRQWSDNAQATDSGWDGLDVFQETMNRWKNARIMKWNVKTSMSTCRDAAEEDCWTLQLNKEGAMDCY